MERVGKVEKASLEVFKRGKKRRGSLDEWKIWIGIDIGNAQRLVHRNPKFCLRGYLVFACQA